MTLPRRNLLMLSGDNSVARGHDSTFYQMLQRFADYWNQIDVLCPGAPDASLQRIHERVFVHPSPWAKLFHPQFIVRKGRELFAERQYSLIISHDYGLFLNGTGARRLAQRPPIPYISEIHHVEGYPRAVNNRERLYRWLAMRYIRRVWRHAAAIRTVNRVELPNLLRELGVPPEKILALPSLYVDLDTFRPMPDQAREYDVIFVGRLVANKGIFTLLDAIGRVQVTHPEVRLGILGRGPLQTAIETRIEALGLNDHVTIIPRVENAAALAQFYNRAGMLICASTSEGGPRVTVEAMACAVPIISTPVGIMPELIEDNVNGMLFHWDAAELADRIRLLLYDDALRRHIGERGCEAVQQFNADAVIEQYARGYHDLIDHWQARGSS
jgi:glycosyltransferase involved in cell wall biosynthesis